MIERAAQVKCAAQRSADEAMKTAGFVGRQQQKYPA
jgi:hypothetical protein